MERVAVNVSPKFLFALTLEREGGGGERKVERKRERKKERKREKSEV